MASPRFKGVCCCCSGIQSCPTLCNPMDCSSAGFPFLVISRSLPKFMFIALVMPSSHSSSDALFCSHPQSFPAWGTFPMCSVHIRWPKYWSFSYSISPSSEYSGLISFKIDWFNLAVQGTFRCLLQHHHSKALVLWCSAFFTVQLSQLYMNPGKTIALTIQTFVGRVMSLLFNTLSRFVIAFLPRSNHLLISWLQSPSAVILEPKKRKSVTTSIFSPLFAMKQWGQMPWS